MAGPPLVHRCSWAEGDALMQDYHDQEWGVPQFDGRALWELLTLEGFQAGLAWITVLRKREAFREAFHKFDPVKVARIGPDETEELMGNARIIRSRAKIAAAIEGARSFLRFEEAGLSFADWVWDFAGGQPIQNTGPVPAASPLSERFSKELKKRGFKFVGPVIVYAWMQAGGIVNDHAEQCFRRKQCARIRRVPRAR